MGDKAQLTRRYKRTKQILWIANWKAHRSIWL